MNGETIEQFVARLGELVELAPAPSNPEGRAAVCDRIVRWLEALGFSVNELGGDRGRNVVVATRPGRGMRLGLCGHYDVEEAGEGWTSRPFTLTRRSSRLHGRGVADNLGPLVLRLQSLERVSAPTASLTFVLQGEEEVGSPLAHAVFPRLELPDVDLWVEETGYFERDGSQRLLARGLDERSARVVDAVEACARDAGRGVVRHDRYLNKAFGEARCPFLTHLVSQRPYVALGPNDPESRIHQPDESLSLDNLPLAMAQFEELVTVAAEVA
jgi:acetylornithine deacetylase/succinyl-diaminopimelate desuccinylase-like protein